MSLLIDTAVSTTIITAAGGLATAVSVPARSRAWGHVVSNGPADGLEIAMTFDDGPTVGATDRLLDELHRFEVPAAFFVIGRNARREPALLREVHGRGHVIGNHSYDHSHFGYLRSRRYWDDQIGRTDAAIEQAIGVRPAMFRPPLGVKSPMIHAAARRAGQAVVTWTRRGMDGVATTPDKICNRFGPHVRGGDILLLHDGIEPNHWRDPSTTIAALGPIITDLRSRGFRFVPLDRLVGLPAYQSLQQPPMS